MNRITMSEEEGQSIEQTIDEVTSIYTSSEDPRFLKDASLYAHELPRRLRSFLNDFRLFESSGICVISGFPVCDPQLGKTPSHWNQRAAVSTALKQEVLLVLFGSLLGEAVGWATQQSGYIVHDVVPIRGHEKEQLGTGCEQLLWWHNEDAFHEYRGDYLGMMCLRNPDGVATTVACMEELTLDRALIELLFEPKFSIKPDESHTKRNAAHFAESQNVRVSAEISHQKIEKMKSNPPRIPVLFGDPEAPYMRLDPYFMTPAEDERAQAALDRFIALIDANLQDLILQPGDYCFIDNYRAVHGRRPFTARFDGTDRWLKRINIVRDLRKSRSARIEAFSRVIY